MYSKLRWTFVPAGRVDLPGWAETEAAANIVASITKRLPRHLTVIRRLQHIAITPLRKRNSEVSVTSYRCTTSYEAAILYIIAAAAWIKRPGQSRTPATKSSIAVLSPRLDIPAQST